MPEWPCVTFADRTVPEGTGAVFAFLGCRFRGQAQKNRAIQTRARFELSVWEKVSADAACPDEAERTEGGGHNRVADTRLAVGNLRVPGDLNEIGLAEDEQHRGVTLGVERRSLRALMVLI